VFRNHLHQSFPEQETPSFTNHLKISRHGTQYLYVNTTKHKLLPQIDTELTCSTSTGGTGYIGGSVLHTIATAHPEYNITVLLRRTPEAFHSTYPNITVIQGDYSSTELIASAAEKADIVLHNGDSDHEPSLNAIISGLLRRSTPGYLIHLSGAGLISDWADTERLGTPSPKIWSDVSSLPEIRQIPTTAATAALHGNTEAILHDTVAKHADKINIAIMCPPDIYGKGKGLGKTHSAYVPFFVKAVLRLQDRRVFYYNQGTNLRGWVHIDDVMRLYLHVVETAASGKNSEQYFNNNGYYFAATQEHSHIELAKAVGEVLYRHDVIESAAPIQLSLEQLDSTANHPAFPKLARYIFASNGRTRPERAENLFGYKGEAPGLFECLEADVLDAVERA
jgi:nucleoside-diphosphate-sugar epimerase